MRGWRYRAARPGSSNVILPQTSAARLHSALARASEHTAVTPGSVGLGTAQLARARTQSPRSLSPPLEIDAALAPSAENSPTAQLTYVKPSVILHYYAQEQQQPARRPFAPLQPSVPTSSQVPAVAHPSQAMSQPQPVSAHDRHRAVPLGDRAPPRAQPVLSAKPVACQGLRHASVLVWAQGTSTRDHHDAQVQLKRSAKAGDAVHSVLCSQQAVYITDGTAVCAHCHCAWRGPTAPRSRASNTQGAYRTPLYNKVQHWLSTSGNREPAADTQRRKRTSKQRQRRAAEREAPVTPRTLAIARDVAQAPPELRHALTSMLHAVANGKLDEQQLAAMNEYLFNFWRQGKDVHGCRYHKGSAALALGAAVQMRQAQFLRRFMHGLSVGRVPAARTLKRRQGAACELQLGVQPEVTFSAVCATEGRSKRMHLCADEAALSQQLEQLRCSEGHEIVGLADRIARSAVPEPARVLLRSSDGKVEHVDGDSSTTHELSMLPSILIRHQRATQACLWLLFDPIRGGTISTACLVPTRGDLTAADDAMFYHQIAVAANAGGCKVSYYGGDAASPHAQFMRGILAPMGNAEEKALVAALRAGAEVADLFFQHQRPIGVLQRAQKLVKEHPERPIAARMQWLVPYPGACAAVFVCDVTGISMGVSHEWRHSSRLNVRFPIVLGLAC